MPMSRGILESIYVKMKPGVTAADLKNELQGKYKDEPFVHILDGNAAPQTRHVRGSNLCYINVYQDRVPNRAIIISVIGAAAFVYMVCWLFTHFEHMIDNLVRGASGQAIQNMNIMLGKAYNCW